jgi:hypothetical protein
MNGGISFFGAAGVQVFVLVVPATLLATLPRVVAVPSIVPPLMSKWGVVGADAHGRNVDARAFP